jgi:DNA polymerase-3 subunit gamma/tau
LTTKYRPNTLNKIIGNEMTVAKLKKMLSRQEDQHRTFMLYGPTGCGKTTIGRIIARRLGCKELREYNAANTRGIDTIRELDSECRYAPLEGAIKVYLLDECHKLTNEAQNALLKLTEEPPPRVYFILCTTDHQKMIPTLRTGRLARFKVELLNFVQITELLDYVLEQELMPDFPRKAVRQIAKLADGIPREALSLLDTVIDIEDEEDLMKAILDSKVHEGDLRELCRVLLETRRNRWPEIFNILETINEEAEDIRYGILEYFRKVLGNNPSPRLGWMMNRFSETMIYSKRPGLYLACWEVVFRDSRN